MTDLARDWLKQGAQIRRNPDLLAVEMDGDLVMMSVERGEYFGVSGIGPRIWELLEQPRTFDGLIESLCAEYDVAEDTCRADATGFLDQLAANAMILVE